MDDDITLYPETHHPYIKEEESGSPLLKVLSGPLRPREYALPTGEFIIGRDEGADIIIPEVLVSRRHAIIKRKINEYMISDLRSTNGVYINNLKTEKAVLHNGDVIQIGSCVFQFVWNRLSNVVNDR